MRSRPTERSGTSSSAASTNAIPASSRDACRYAKSARCVRFAESVRYARSARSVRSAPPVSMSARAGRATSGAWVASAAGLATWASDAPRPAQDAPLAETVRQRRQIIALGRPDLRPCGWSRESLAKQASCGDRNRLAVSVNRLLARGPPRSMVDQRVPLPNTPMATKQRQQPPGDAGENAGRPLRDDAGSPAPDHLRR